jgi:signal transduction histidine kinase
LNQNVPLGKYSQAFDLRELIQEIAGLVGAQARRQHVDLQVHLPEQSMAIDGCRDRLRQALLNIVIRSLGAMRQGGELLIDAVVRNGVADISFEDDGVYLPADALNERGRAYFVSAKTADKASLYVTRLVVESHGGEIFLEDKVGQGARIKLTLPLDREKLLAQFIAHGAKYDRKVE